MGRSDAGVDPIDQAAFRRAAEQAAETVSAALKEHLTNGMSRFEAAVGALYAAYIVARPLPSAHELTLTWLREMLDALGEQEANRRTGLEASAAANEAIIAARREIERDVRPAGERFKL